MGTVSAVLGGFPYFDTNIVIYALEGLPAFHSVLRAILSAIDSGEIVVGTSELALAEALVKPKQTKNLAGEQAILRFFEPSEAMKPATVSRDVLLRAATIRATSTTLKLADAIHLATAVELACTALLSNDRRFKAASSIPVVLLSELAQKLASTPD